MTEPMQDATHAPRCRAHSVRNGYPCKNPPMVGQHVCRMHGGAAPQAKKSARDRLADMVEPVLTNLLRIALSGESDTVQLAASRDVLDRAGLKAVQVIQADEKIVIEVVRREQPIVLEQLVAEHALGNGRTTHD